MATFKGTAMVHATYKDADKERRLLRALNPGAEYAVRSYPLGKKQVWEVVQTNRFEVLT